MLITGASRGLGLATAQLAAVSGYRLILTGRSSRRLEAVAQELGGAKRARPIACDMSVERHVEAMATRAREAYGRIDVAVLNAAVNCGPGLAQHPRPWEWHDALMTNVFGTAVAIRYLASNLLSQRGQFILIGSVAGKVVVPGSFYAVTKHAVTALATALKAELTSSGVRVSIVHPGLMQTSMISSGESRPMLSPEDVARAILFVASQPQGIEISELTIRPQAEDLYPHKIGAPVDTQRRP